jgi:hypothetical protein
MVGQGDCGYGDGDGSDDVEPTGTRVYPVASKNKEITLAFSVTTDYSLRLLRALGRILALLSLLEAYKPDLSKTKNSISAVKACLHPVS